MFSCCPVYSWQSESMQSISSICSGQLHIIPFFSSPPRSQTFSYTGSKLRKPPSSQYTVRSLDAALLPQLDVSKPNAYTRSSSTGIEGRATPRLSMRQLEQVRNVKHTWLMHTTYKLHLESPGLSQRRLGLATQRHDYVQSYMCVENMVIL